MEAANSVRWSLHLAVFPEIILSPSVAHLVLWGLWRSAWWRYWFASVWICTIEMPSSPSTHPGPLFFSSSNPLSPSVFILLLCLFDTYRNQTDLTDVLCNFHKICWSLWLLPYNYGGDHDLFTLYWWIISWRTCAKIVNILWILPWI